MKIRGSNLGLRLTKFVNITINKYIVNLFYANDESITRSVCHLSPVLSIFFLFIAAVYYAAGHVESTDIRDIRINIKSE